jgi:hypothetical protein
LLPMKTYIRLLNRTGSNERDAGHSMRPGTYDLPSDPE